MFYKGALTAFLCLLCMLTCAQAFAVLPASGRPSSFLDSYGSTCLTLDDGLQHDFIDDMCMDSEGFLWVAMSGGGVSRYDGYEFTNFSTTVPGRRIKSNFVMEIAEDGFGRLWVATDAGLNLIDIRTLECSEPVDLSGMLGEKADMTVWSVEIAADGNVWIATSTGLSCLRLDSKGDIVGVSSFDPPLRVFKQVKNQGCRL